MDDRAREEKDAAEISETRRQLNAFFEAFFAEAQTDRHSELFYKQQARQLQEISPECISALTRRLQKADWAEQDALVQLLARFTGVEHVSFLQEFVGREAFMPKTGMKILDIFNKSDVIISSGVAGSLLDYDNFAQRITRALMTDCLDDGLVRDFLASSRTQQDGITAQLLEDYGPRSAPFLERVCALDKKEGERILDMLEGCDGDRGFRVMESMYAAGGRKDILKRMKKAARALSQKGISVALPQAGEKSAPVFQSAGLAPARAFASTIDAEGYRILFLVKPVSPHESKVFHMVTNDSSGVHTFDVFAAIRGESSQLIKKLLQDTKSDFREIETGHCLALAMEAVEIARSQGRIVPATVAQLEAHFAGCIGHQTAPAIYGVLSADAVAALDPSPDTGALADAMEAAFWFIVTPEGKSSWEALARQAAERTGDIPGQARACAAEALASFFTAGRRHVFKRRLEELAFIMHAKGYADQARAALAAAQNLAASQHDPARDPFCSRMIDRAFEIFKKSLEDKKGGPAVGKAVNG